MAQPSISSFLGTPTPADRRTGQPMSQSESCHSSVGANNSLQCAQQAPRKSRSQASSAKQKRTKKTQRKQKRDEKKKKSRDSDSASINESIQKQHATQSSLVMDDQSLTELLGSDNVPPKAASSPSSSDHSQSDSYKRTICDLRQQAEGLRKQNSALQHQVELLEEELNNAKKLDKNKKNELKRLTKDNDNLRREISRIGGVRKFVSTPCNDATNGDSTNNNQELLHTANAQLESLREHVADVANTLLSFFKDGNPRAQTTSHQSHSTEPLEGPAPTFPIPVVQIGLARQQAEVGKPASTSPSTGSDTYAGAAARQLRQRPRTATRSPAKELSVIGTSLTRGLGNKLVSRGISTTVHTYAGAEIPYIRSRVQNILPKDDSHKVVLLQCGGNDVENYHVDRVIDQYEGLIKDVRIQCPNAEIVLSAIPPRRNNKATLRNIRYVNDYLRDRGMRKDGVKTIDVVPKLPRYFLRDQVHFNDKGKQLYADNIKDTIENFGRRPLTQHV